MISEKIQQEKQERKCGGTGEGAFQQHRSSKQLLQGEGEKKENTEGGIHKADQPQRNRSRHMLGKGQAVAK